MEVDDDKMTSNMDIALGDEWKGGDAKTPANVMFRKTQEELAP